MKDFLDKNLKTAKKYYTYYEMMMQEGKESAYPLANKQGKLYFNKEGMDYLLSSRRPKEESRYLLNKIEFDKDNLLVLFGMANVQLIEDLMNDMSPESRLIVFEPNMAVFEYIMRRYDWSVVIASGRAVFLAGNYENVEKYIVPFFEKWLNLVQNLQVLSLPNYYLFSEFRLHIIKKISEVFQLKLNNLGNCVEDTLIGLDNMCLNAESCMEANSINEIRDRYKGYPAVIVASGPSLDKNIEYLKQAQGKALIISCDASYRSCLAHGVKPDIIVSIERVFYTYQYYYQEVEFPDDLVLAGPPVLHPDIFKKVPGKKLIMSKSEEGIAGWWGKHFDGMEYLDMGHSCATAGFRIAECAGCSPIMLMGQDLAYTDDKIHGNMVHTKYEGENKVYDDPDFVWTKDIFGNPIKTCDAFNVFRYYFENRILTLGLDVIDATEGGAYIKGTRIMRLEEAIEQHCRKDIPFTLNGLLEEKRMSDSQKKEKYREIQQSALDTVKELKAVQEKALAYHTKLISYKEYEFESATKEELVSLLKAMEPCNQIIPYIYEEHSRLLDYYNQDIRQTIIHVKKIGNAVTAKNVKRNWDLLVNLLEMIMVISAAAAIRFQKASDYMGEEGAKLCLEA